MYIKIAARCGAERKRFYICMYAYMAASDNVTGPATIGWWTQVAPSTSVYAFDSAKVELLKVRTHSISLDFLTAPLAGHSPNRVSRWTRGQMLFCTTAAKCVSAFNTHTAQLKLPSTTWQVAAIRFDLLHVLVLHTILCSSCLPYLLIKIVILRDLTQNLKIYIFKTCCEMSCLSRNWITCADFNSICISSAIHGWKFINYMVKF